VDKMKPYVVELQPDGSMFSPGPSLAEQHRFANQWCATVHADLGAGVTDLHGYVFLGRAVLEGWEVEIQTPSEGEIPESVTEHFDQFGEGRWAGLEQLGAILAAVEAIEKE